MDSLDNRDFTTAGGDTTEDGQFFRDFHNFGRPLPPAPLPAHLYWRVIRLACRAAWYSLAGLPAQLGEQYRYLVLAKGTYCQRCWRKLPAIGKLADVP